jgi:hypothetical protein
MKVNTLTRDQIEQARWEAARDFNAGRMAQGRLDGATQSDRVYRRHFEKLLFEADDRKRREAEAEAEQIEAKTEPKAV